jgi:Zn-dependent protease with chaperone function
VASVISCVPAFIFSSEWFNPIIMSDPQDETTGPMTEPHISTGVSLRLLWRAFFMVAVLPALVLVFYIAAPFWLESKIRPEIIDGIDSSSQITLAQKTELKERFSKVSLRKLCIATPPGFEDLRGILSPNVVDNFKRQHWCMMLSILLLGGLAVGIGTIWVLNGIAVESLDRLITCYRWSWRIAMTMALIQLLILIPLITYGVFEFTILLFNRIIPMLLFGIAFGGVVALLKSIQVLLRKPCLAFQEPMSRDVSPEEAPGLWQVVRQCAEVLQTEPPDRIIIGMNFNFFATEMVVINDSGQSGGRTLFMSYPLLKHLSAEEIISVIGHELGHFIGEDTRMTREFSPMKFKVHATLETMCQSGWVGWPSCQLLGVFDQCFLEAEQAASRKRELLADEKAVAITSPDIFARALLKIHVLSDAYVAGLHDMDNEPSPKHLSSSLLAIVREKLLPDPGFWAGLLEKSFPHPLDSHPPLRIRMEALGLNIGTEEAQAMVMEETESAYDCWFADRDDLFAGITSQAEEVAGKYRAQSKVDHADYQTDEGRRLLDHHFPEIRWRLKPTDLKTAVSMVVVFLMMFGLGLVMIPGTLGKTLFVIVMTALLVFGLVVLRNKRNGEFVLSPDGIRYTGWTRPLCFCDVHEITTRENNSMVTVTFWLNQKQPPYQRFSIPGISVRSVEFPLNSIEGNPETLFQVIHRYHSRQMDPC